MRVSTAHPEFIPGQYQSLLECETVLGANWVQTSLEVLHFQSRAASFSRLHYPHPLVAQWYQLITLGAIF